MLIKEIFIQNFKCWKELILKDLSKYNVIIGENNLGKSSIFEAILSCVFTNKENLSMIKRKEQGLTVKLNFDIHHPNLIRIILDTIRLHTQKPNKFENEFFTNTYHFWDDYDFTWQMSKNKLKLYMQKSCIFVWLQNLCFNVK